MARLHLDDTLLLVIDVQERLAPLIEGHSRVTARARALAEGCHLLGVPVVFTEQYPKGLGSTVKELADIVERVGGPLEKTSFSCVADDAVKARVDAEGKANVVLAGMEAHICVLQTALDLLESGRTVYVAQDAVGSRTEVDKDAGVARAQRAGAWPATTEMVLFELMGGSRHPRFKDVQALIK